MPPASISISSRLSSYVNLRPIEENTLLPY